MSDVRLACQCCEAGGVHLSFAGADVDITDAAGKQWRFEMHPYSGPLVLGKRGDPLTRQPGSRSPFWPAFEQWNDNRKGEA